MEIRVAATDDLKGIASTLAGAFEDDPLWGWAFPERADLEVWWRFFAGSALRYPWTWISGDCEAVSVWIPPGGIEFTPDEEAAIKPLLADLIGPREPEVSAVLERFEANHPTGRPHYYLSLLGTHPDHRGMGVGTALLAENLRAIDLERAPAYLESTNPSNVARYEGLGFHEIGGFSRPDGGALVSTMWRDAR